VSDDMDKYFSCREAASNRKVAILSYGQTHRLSLGTVVGFSVHKESGGNFDLDFILTTGETVTWKNMSDKAREQVQFVIDSFFIEGVVPRIRNGEVHGGWTSHH
jgi:hypothetical protein